MLYKVVELASSFSGVQILTCFGCTSRLRLDPNKNSGVGKVLGLLVHILTSRIEQAMRSESKYDFELGKAKNNPPDRLVRTRYSF